MFFTFANKIKKGMKKILLCAMLALTCFCYAQAQFFGVDPEKLGNLMSGLTRLPYDNARMLMSQTFKALESDAKGYRKAVEMLDRLGDPTDSIHNEVLYMEGLKTVTSSFVLSNSEKDRPKFLLQMAQKNAIGAPATDLTLATADGKTAQLLGGQVPTLVFFNDLNCDACAKAREALAASATLSDYVGKGLLRVVAVYTGKSEKDFKKAAYPAWVTSTWDKTQQIEQADAYILNTTPLFYLLNGDRCVLVKNEPSLKRVESALAKMMLSSDRTTPALVKQLFNN